MLGRLRWVCYVCMRKKDSCNPTGEGGLRVGMGLGTRVSSGLFMLVAEARSGQQAQTSPASASARD